MAFNPSLHPRAGTGPGGGRFITAKSNPQSNAAARGAKRKLGGKLTTQDIRRFQRQRGLTVDGVIGRQTAAALLGNPNAKNIATGRMTDKQHAALRKFGKVKGNVQSVNGKSSSSSRSSSKKSSASKASTPKKSSAPKKKRTLDEIYGLKPKPKKVRRRRRSGQSTTSFATSMTSRISSNLSSDRKRNK